MGAAITGDAEVGPERRTVTLPVRDVGRDVSALLAQLRTPAADQRHRVVWRDSPGRVHRLDRKGIAGMIGTLLRIG